MKKVLIFSTDDFVPPTGGAEIAIGEITKRLPGFEFDLFCARIRKNTSKFEKIDNVNIYRLGLGIPKLDKALLMTLGERQALKIHKKEPYQLVWSVMASYGGFAAVRFKKRTGTPFLLTLQEGDQLESIEHKVRYGFKYFKNIFLQADGLQAISNFLFDWGQRMGFGGKIGKVVPNGVDIANFTRQCSQQEISETRNSFGFSKNSLILMTASRLEKKNGIGDVITALKILPEKICFVICGFGSLQEQLKRQVQDSGLGKRVKFLGLVTHENLPKILKASDIFIRPSLTEGLGSAFLEAMAAGTIIIGTLVGGIPDFLKEGITGFVCRPKNPESIAAAVTKIMSLDNLDLVRVRSYALDLIKKEYNWDSISKKMENIFDQLIEEKN
jgi:glycosyltransferase involved in cell wall biosynthesis